MKTFVTFIVFGLLWLNAIAQAPRAFKYQAVVRNTSGEVLANKTVSFRIGILGGSATGTAVYTETHTGKTTNSFGLVDLEIGKGAPVTGTFAGISWGTSDYFLKVEMDPNGGSAYQAMGTNQLLSVPYALFARDVENNADGDADATNELQKLTISGTVLTLDKGGQSVILPSGGTSGDNWGTQVVVTDPTLAGNGAPVTPLKIADNGVTSAKIQDGALVTADLADNAVTSEKIADGAIVTADLADQTVSTAKLGNLAVSADKMQNGAVTTDKIANGAVTGVKIAQASATDGQVLKWKSASSAWAPGDDATGAGGLTLPWSGSTTDGTVGYAFTVISNGSDIGAIKGKQANTAEYSRGYGVCGESSSPDGSGVYALSTGDSGRGLFAEGHIGAYVIGDTRGIYATSNGIGVEGRSSSLSGYGLKGYSPYCGVYGETWKSGGYGIFGKSDGDPYSDITCGVYGEAKTENAFGVKGLVSNTDGRNYGLYGESKSSVGFGVYGTSPGTGVYGKSDGFQNVAVMGEATADNSIGVKGLAATNNSTGVYGEGARQGIYGISANYGVYGTSTGFKGRAIFGEATGTNSVGIQGTAVNSNGTGVWGEGDNQGVYGVSALTTGKGVYGSASHTTGANFGVYGESLSAVGTGVYGKAPLYGVYGISSAVNSFGVYGKSTSTTGYGVYGDAQKIGVYGVASLATGTGVYGEAPKYGMYGFSTAAAGCGVYGISSSTSGYGLYGEAPVYGVYAKSTGNTGRALKAEATGTGSIGVWGVALGDNSTGVYGQGANYDFYAAGPGVNYGEASSIRWKSNIIPIPDPLGKILAVRGVYFDWDQEHGGQHDVGMIAEEVGKVMPEIVVYESNGVDANGMDYSKITPLLLEAIKAQQAEIERLKEKLEQLEKLVGASAQK